MALPIEFHYDESEYVGERWFFILRNLADFVGDKGRNREYKEFKDDDCVLEFVKAELDDGSKGEGPWFMELIKLRLLGHWAPDQVSEERKKKNNKLS